MLHAHAVSLQPLQQDPQPETRQSQQTPYKTIDNLPSAI